MTTIYDVAELAEVSPATVSRVLNGGKVSPDRVKRVMDAAAQLDFHPNRNARRLRTQTSELIGMVIPDIQNPYYTQITRAVEDVAGARGYAVMLCNTDDDPEKEAAYLRALVSEPVAGIICAPSSVNTSFDLALMRRVPVVFLDRTVPNLPFDAVVVNNRPAAAEATRMLFEDGHTRVAAISGPVGIETADLRLAGFVDAWQERFGTPPPPELIRRTTYTIAGGREMTNELLALPEPPQAIFAANNRLAIGTLRALAFAERQPPEIGVFSFGELPLIAYPPRGVLISSMPSRELGTEAARLLLDRLDGSTAPPHHIKLSADVASAREVRLGI